MGLIQKKVSYDLVNQRAVGIRLDITHQKVVLCLGDGNVVGQIKTGILIVIGSMLRMVSDTTNSQCDVSRQILTNWALSSRLANARDTLLVQKAVTFSEEHQNRVCLWLRYPWPAGDEE